MIAEQRMAVHPLECRGMRYLGRHHMAGHGNCGEGTALLERGGARYLYIAHERGPVNFSVLDVTDPRAPRLLAQPTLPHGVAAACVRIRGPSRTRSCWPPPRSPRQARAPPASRYSTSAAHGSRARSASWTCQAPARAAPTG